MRGHDLKTIKMINRSQTWLCFGITWGVSKIVIPVLCLSDPGLINLGCLLGISLLKAPEENPICSQGWKPVLKILDYLLLLRSEAYKCQRGEGIIAQVTMLMMKKWEAAQTPWLSVHCSHGQHCVLLALDIECKYWFPGHSLVLGKWESFKDECQPLHGTVSLQNHFIHSSFCYFIAIL